MLEKLPFWRLTKGIPANYDTESATAIEMVAKLYAAISDIITAYNQFETDVNKTVEDFTTGRNTDYELFKLSVQQSFQDLANTVELTLTQYDQKFANQIQSVLSNLNANLSESIQQSIMNNVNTLLQNKVDKDGNKVLSDNNFTNEEKAKLQALTSTGEFDLSAYATLESVYIKEQIDSMVQQLNSSIGNKAESNSVYNKTTIDEKLSVKANSNNVYTKTQVDTALGLKASSNHQHPASDISGLPTKTSDLTNDSDFITLNDIPSSLLIKQNVSVTPIANTDTSTNTSYPYCFEVSMSGVTSNHIPDASLGIGVECSEFVGIASDTDKVILYFSGEVTTTPITFSYVSATKGSVIADV